MLVTLHNDVFIPISVNRELSSTFARLCNQADLSKEKLEGEIKELDKAITQLTVVSSKAKGYR